MDSNQTTEVYGPFRDYPVDLLPHVGAQLVSNDPAETWENFIAFEQTFPAAKVATRGGNVGKFKERLRKLLNLAGKIRDNVLPDESFAEPKTSSRPLSSRVTEAAPIFQLLNAEKQKEIIGKIFAFADKSERGYSVYSIAADLKYLKKENQKYFIERAIAEYRHDPDSLYQGTIAAALIRATPFHAEFKDSIVAMSKDRNISFYGWRRGLEFDSSWSGGKPALQASSEIEKGAGENRIDENIDQTIADLRSTFEISRMKEGDVINTPHQKAAEAQRRQAVRSVAEQILTAYEQIQRHLERSHNHDISGPRDRAVKLDTSTHHLKDPRRAELADPRDGNSNSL